ncbi:MAG: sugar transferase [Clostridia bacterium]|nr:sugar transferase [Clostridia bacterium]
MHTNRSDSALRHLDFAFFDVVVMQLSFIMMYGITKHQGFLYNDEQYVIQASVFLVVQIALGLFSNAYDRIYTRGMYEELKSLLLNIAMIELLSGAFILMTHTPVKNKELLIVAGLYFDINFFVRQANKARHLRKGLPKRKVAIVTSGDRVFSVLRRLRENTVSAEYELSCVILLDEAPPERYDDLGVPVFYAYGELILEKITRLWIDDAFVLLEDNVPYPKSLMANFLYMGITIHTSLSVLDDFSNTEVGVEELGSFKVITNSIRFVSDSALFLKRAVDIAGGLIGTIGTGMLTLIIGPLIYIKSPGPIFFAQKRIGLNGRVFKMYKFRSMYMDAEKRKAELMEKNKVQGGLMFKMDDDPRIIGSEKKGRDGKPKGIGNFIRNTSLDEFPQFFNVLKGDMSLVGTRPPTLDEWNQYDPRHRIRMSVKPGITGMWQVSGRSKITDFEQVVALDQKYIDNWSVWLDFKILAKTVQVVLQHDGAV